MPAWNNLLRHRINGFPHRCRGFFRTPPDQIILDQLRARLEKVGFDKPVSTGPFCGVVQRSDAAVTYHDVPAEEPPEVAVFHAGAVDESELRRILGFLATDTALTIEDVEGNPL